MMKKGDLPIYDFQQPKHLPCTSKFIELLTKTSLVFCKNRFPTQGLKKRTYNLVIDHFIGLTNTFHGPLGMLFSYQVEFIRGDRGKERSIVIG